MKFSWGLGDTFIVFMFIFGLDTKSYERVTLKGFIYFIIICSPFLICLEKAALNCHCLDVLTFKYEIEVMGPEIGTGPSRVYCYL